MLKILCALTPIETSEGHELCVVHTKRTLHTAVATRGRVCVQMATGEHFARFG